MFTTDVLVTVFTVHFHFLFFLIEFVNCVSFFKANLVSHPLRNYLGEYSAVITSNFQFLLITETQHKLK